MTLGVSSEKREDTIFWLADQQYGPPTSSRILEWTMRSSFHSQTIATERWEGQEAE